MQQGTKLCQGCVGGDRLTRSCGRVQGLRDGGKWRRAGGGDTGGAGWQEKVVQLVQGAGECDIRLWQVARWWLSRAGSWQR